MMYQSTLSEILPKQFSNDEVIFACIGTDRSTGDALGPLVGTFLEELGYTVIGTLDNPLHALNITDRLSTVPKDKTLIAIDACLGQEKNIGKVLYQSGPMYPGRSVGKDLPPVGDYAIKGVVNIGGFMSQAVLQCTRLNTTMNLAKEIVRAVQENIIVKEESLV